MPRQTCSSTGFAPSCAPLLAVAGIVSSCVSGRAVAGEAGRWCGRRGGRRGRSIAREATEALAIHHEHRTRDLETARAFALQTLDSALPPARGRDVQHRLARIDRKRSLAANTSLRATILHELPLF